MYKDFVSVLAVVSACALGFSAGKVSSEVKSSEMKNVEQHYSSRTEFISCDEVYEGSLAIENRDGKFVWYTVRSLVTDGDKGVGVELDDFGKTEYEIRYNPGVFRTGDVVTSYCLLNPGSDYFDDVVDRFDVKERVFH